METDDEQRKLTFFSEDTGSVSRQFMHGRYMCAQYQYGHYSF